MRRIGLAVVWGRRKAGLYVPDEAEQGPAQVTSPAAYSRRAVGDIVRGRNQGAVKIST